MRLDSDPLPAELAQAFERTRPRMGRLGSPLLYFRETTSTNDVAAALVGNGGHEGAVVVADAQTAGRGRRGRVWHSPPARGLYVSVITAPGRARQSPQRAVALLTLAAGVALAEAVERTTGLSPHIKWPNDLMVRRRKLAGILAEGIAAREGADSSALAGGAPGSGETFVVLGYGVNVSPAVLPVDLAARTTSLESELGRAVDRAALCAESVASLAARYADLLAGGFDAILDAWRTRAPASRGARVSWDTPAGPQTGITAGVDDLGALLVRVGSRVERIVAGEVTWM